VARPVWGGPRFYIGFEAMTVAILDPFSGISGDMTLGALVAVGLDPDWLRALPERLGLPDVRVSVRTVMRAGLACEKVDFEIPPQPHGRHIKQIREMVAAAKVPPSVAEKADRAFTAIAECEAAIHGTTVDRVHLHEVGAVDAILDIVGSIWGFELLGVDQVFCGTLTVGDGFVEAAHGVLPVPAPATLKLLEGLRIRSGPEGAGELLTPTGAALVRVLSSGPPPAEYVPRRSGFGAGTKDPRDRANALRLVLAELPPIRGGGREELVLLACDVDDMTGEELGELTEGLRGAGALDVTLTQNIMKKGRPGHRVEVLSLPGDADALEADLFRGSSTIGVRRTSVSRRALDRREETVMVSEHPVRVKVVSLPGGGSRAKPEMDDVRHVARVTGSTIAEVSRRALAEWER